MTQNDQEIRTGYISCWSNTVSGNKLKINVSEIEPSNRLDVQDDFRTNDVLVISKKVSYPITKLKILYAILSQYRIGTNSNLFDCEVEHILDVINTSVY